jgi:hypothetical protein
MTMYINGRFNGKSKNSGAKCALSLELLLGMPENLKNYDNLLSTSIVRSSD